MPKLIQENFGQEIMDSIHRFASNDIPDVLNLEETHFDHITNASLRKILAETYYGTRWIYKLGLSLLVRDEKQLAHVRAQIIDYSSICESILANMIEHAINRGITRGGKYRIANLVKNIGIINWANIIQKDEKLGKLGFYWLIYVAEDENIISNALQGKLHLMRKERNSVHLISRTHKAYIGTSKRLYDILHETINETKRWKSANP